MCKMIHDILVIWDSSVSWEDIHDVVHDCIQTLTWEGKKLGRIECMRDGQQIHIHAFEKPFITTVCISRGV